MSKSVQHTVKLSIVIQGMERPLMQTKRAELVAFAEELYKDHVMAIEDLGASQVVTKKVIA
jgi:hypothetical protein